MKAENPNSSNLWEKDLGFWEEKMRVGGKFWEQIWTPRLQSCIHEGINT